MAGRRGASILSMPMTRSSASLPVSRRDRRAQARREHVPARSRRNRAGSRPSWRSPLVVVTTAALALGLVAVFLANRPPASSSTALSQGPTSYPATLTDGTSLGSPTAPVVIELYADFQCPACRQFVTLELPRLVTDYVVPGTVRVEAHDLDILGRGTRDESLELAAGAVCAAEQDRYWQYHDLVFWNQGRENMGDHDAAFIAAVADQAGVDPGRWRTCFSRSDIRAPIGTRTAAARRAGIQYTPTLLVNGTSMVGVPVYEELAATIDRLAGVSGAPVASPAPSPTSS